MATAHDFLVRIQLFKSAILAHTCSLALLAMVATPTAAQTAKHPLDGLTVEEYWAVYETLKGSGHVDSKSRYDVVLREPPKEEVLAWKPGQPFRREVLVVVKQGPSTFEAVVDANDRKLISWKGIKGVQPHLTEEERTAAVEAVKENPEWRAAMRKRGVTDYDTLYCEADGYGYFGTPEEQGRRLLYIGCRDRRREWAATGLQRTIEGIVVIWDADKGKVLRVIDTGVVPVPRPPTNSDFGPPREVPTPITVQQPLGPSFRVEGHEVTWQKWNFHFRIDQRGGLVVSNVRYMDGDKVRSILYEGSLTEVFISYMDPDEGWWESSFFDLGEGGGALSSPLEPDSDCPENSIYFEQVYASQKGMPMRIPRAACLFEQYAGGFAWRHTWSGGAVESRRQRDLVLRTIGDFGNYNTAFDWVFRQDGTIKVRVGLTGLDQQKTVASQTAADDHDGQADAYGRFIAENAVGVNHDHFFSFRLDFDVDGTANSFVRDRLSTKRLPPNTPRKSMWVVEPEVARIEQQAKLRMSMEKPEIWRVINPNVKNAMGYPVGYEIVPGENAMPLLLPEDYPQRRAGFTDYQVWVTRYQENERYAAGDYPMLSKGGDGLPAWTKANRGIENTDIVLWYTMGFHHVPRSEDWPTMPTVWHEFELRPCNFFSRNPALDLPK